MLAMRGGSRQSSFHNFTNKLRIASLAIIDAHDCPLPLHGHGLIERLIAEN